MLLDFRVVRNEAHKPYVMLLNLPAGISIHNFITVRLQNDSKETVMALVLSPDSIRRYNVSADKWEMEKLSVDTEGKQWIITPCHIALLAVYHTISGWVVDGFAMETAGDVQPLFKEILIYEPLPDRMSELPAQGPRFTISRIRDQTLLLASNGDAIYSAELKLQSIVVTNELADDEVPTETTPETANLLPANKLWNYVYGCCRHFPLDDAMSLELVKGEGLCHACRT